MVLLGPALAMGVRDFATAPQPSYSIVRGDVVCGSLLNETTAA